MNVRSLQLEYAKLLLKALLMSLLLYDRETMIRMEKERFGIRAVQMDNFRVLLGIKRMDRVPNAWMRELFGMMMVGE